MLSYCTTVRCTVGVQHCRNSCTVGTHVLSHSRNLACTTYCTVWGKLLAYRQWIFFAQNSKQQTNIEPINLLYPPTPRHTRDQVHEMPLLNFSRKGWKSEFPSAIDVTRNRSTESTFDTGTNSSKAPLATASSVATPTSGPWRTKEPSSVVRPGRPLSSDREQEDLWTLKRCDAFDEDDDC